MNADLMYQLTNERLRERRREAQSERLAAQVPDPRAGRPDRRFRAAALGHLLAVRRHAAQ